MKSWKSIVTVLVFLAPWHASFAGGFWRYYISVEDRPAFTGGIGVSDDGTPPRYLVDSIRLGAATLNDKSFLDPNTVGDVTLTGDIAIWDQTMHKCRLKRLRLVFQPDLGHNEGDRRRYWRIHPEDAESIIAYYQGGANRVRVERAAVIAGGVLLVLGIAAYIIRRWSGRVRLVGVS